MWGYGYWLNIHQKENTKHQYIHGVGQNSLYQLYRDLCSRLHHRGRSDECPPTPNQPPERRAGCTAGAHMLERLPSGCLWVLLSTRAKVADRKKRKQRQKKFLECGGVVSVAARLHCAAVIRCRRAARTHFSAKHTSMRVKPEGGFTWVNRWVITVYITCELYALFDVYFLTF